MIVGLGIDLVEISRIKKVYLRFGSAFASKILHPEEEKHLKNKYNSPNQAVLFLASRFAAKEAAVKALGTGFTNGIGFQSICVCSSSSGQPSLRLHGAAASTAQKQGITNSFLSITHSRDTAGAVVIFENNGDVA